MSSSIAFTKMIATLSPWVSDKETLTNFVKSGVNVFRLNFSHGTYEEYEGMIQRIKEVREELQTPVAILQDLQGPRVRVA
ncbi:MAG: pyruvate kinase, partial [Candidatus Paceibacteria bacterium]